jgi:membrane-anchored mycosin MYCP
MPAGGFWAPSHPPPAATPVATGWHLQALGLAAVWTRTQGAGVRLAILDSGVAGVPGLQHRTSWFRPDGVPDSAIDDHNHGTSCAVLAASDDLEIRGVAPRCQVISLRITNASGAPDTVLLRRAFQLLKGEVDVINCSLVLREANTALLDAVREAQRAGAFIVGAAGNRPNVASDFPERTPHVFTVAAMGTNGQPLGTGRMGPWIDVAAPGQALLTRNKYGLRRTDFGHSSGAAALVSGVAALALALAAPGERRYRLSQLLGALIRETATDIGLAGIDPLSGAGAIDPPRLMARVQDELNLMGGNT